MYSSLLIEQKVNIGKKFLLLLSTAFIKPEELKKEIENDPLFTILLKEGVIKRRCLPQFYPSLLFLSDGRWSSFLDEHEAACTILKSIGKDAFCRYFLFPQKIYSIQELLAFTGLSEKQIEIIHAFLDELSLYPIKEVDFKPFAEVIAKVEDKLILFCHAYRIHYSIDNKKASALSLSDEEKERMQELLRKIRVLNTQKTTLFRLLEEIVEHQMDYFETGDEETLKVFTQREAADRVGVHPSWVNRIIKGKYIETSWNIKPLKFFFCTKRQYLKRRLKKLLPSTLSDAKLAKILHQQTGFIVRRRNLASMRKEICNQKA